MAIVTRSNGDTIQINNKIEKTKFDIPKDGEISDIKTLAQISAAISRLEKYGEFVDNCGYTNCCQSCQQLTEECTGECKECIENGCTQCLNCKEADPRTIVNVPEISEQAYVTRQPETTGKDEFLYHGPYILNATSKGLDVSGETKARYYGKGKKHKITYSLKDKTKYRWNGQKDDYIHEISWVMNKATAPVPVVFRYTVFEDFNYDRYHYTFNGRTVDRVALPVSSSQVLTLQNAFAIGPNLPLISKPTRSGYSCDRIIIEFFVPGKDISISDLAYYYYNIDSSKNYSTASKMRSAANLKVPLGHGTITGDKAHTAFARYFTSNLFPVYPNGVMLNEQDMWYFWVDILYMGEQDAAYYNTSFDQIQEYNVEKKAMGVISFDISKCNTIGVPKASYFFVLAWNAFSNDSHQGDIFTGTLPICQPKISVESSEITINGPADIIKYEGTVKGDYSQDLNRLNYTVV